MTEMHSEYVSPRSPRDDVVRGAVTDIKPTRKSCNGDTASHVGSTHVPHARFSQFGESVSLASGLPMLCVPVIHVSHVSAKPKVCRIHAGANVAAVQHVQPFGDRAEMQLPRDAMGTNDLPANRQQPVAARCVIASPYPTITRRVNALPKSDCNRLKWCGIGATLGLSFAPCARLATYRPLRFECLATIETRSGWGRLRAHRTLLTFVAMPGAVTAVARRFVARIIPQFPHSQAKKAASYG